MSFDERIQKLKEVPQGWAQLLPNGKYSGQTEGTGRMAAKPTEILYLASLEKTRTEKEKPDPIGS